jgi:meso-butanediol dehydrogenase / (S,S)-butanediol dehydrogenase / diacetyl reductase
MTEGHLTGSFDGGVAVITGAGSGLGAALADRFAAEGMSVAALDVNADHAARTADAVRARGVPAMSARVDVADASSLADAAREVTAALGACNVLCANVGVQQFGALDVLTPDDWQWVLSVNVLGTVQTVNAFLPLLRASSGRRHIVLTSSVAALAPTPRQGVYVVSKFAVTGYGDVLRQELASEGIGVTIVFPAGMITTHLESSRAARPVALGESVLRDEDIEVVVATAAPQPEDVLAPEEAIANLVPDLLANRPYVITHGSSGAAVEERHRELSAAFRRMNEARRPIRN